MGRRSEEVSMRRWLEAGWIPLLVLMLVAIGPAELVLSTLRGRASAERLNPEVVQMSAWAGVVNTNLALVSIQVTIMIAAALTLVFIRTWSAIKYTIVALWIVGPLW